MDILSQFDTGRVTNPTQAQAFPFRLYDQLIYPLAGLTQFSFFQLPVGQGVSASQGVTAGSSKTYADTNMNMPGSLPSGMKFLVKSIEVSFDPGNSTVTNTFIDGGVNGNLGDWTSRLRDASNVLMGGWLELNVLQQNYVRDAPLLTFPPKTRRTISGTAGATTVAATSINTGVVLPEGRPWYVDGDGIPGITLEPATNFEVKIYFPAAISVDFVSRLRVALDGYVLRASQ